jgi:hypothetical protein
VATRVLVDRFVTALAKALERHRAYPPESSLCRQSIEACQRALHATGREQIELRPLPKALLVDDRKAPWTPLVARMGRLFNHVGVGGVAILAQASARDLAWFCRELLAREASDADDALPDSLAARGVRNVQVTMLVRPAVLGVGTVTADRLEQLELDERQRREALDSQACGRVCGLDKGWVRLDPGLPAPAQVSIVGLAELVGDPVELARMLAWLTESGSPDDPADALADRFEVISGLFRSAEPGVARTLFARLAQAVLALPEERRARLLRDTVLSGLIEGYVDGSMLRHFPDEELADALTLLLDGRVAGRELMLLALDRIDLPSKRQAQVKSMIADRLSGAARPADPSPGWIEGYEDGRITLAEGTARELRDFTVFDLAVNDEVQAALAFVRSTVQDTQPDIERLRCVVHLLGLEANPDVAGRLIPVGAEVLALLRRRTDWIALAEWIGNLGGTAARVRADRPEIAALIDELIARQIDEALVRDLLALAGEEAGRSAARKMLDALGAPAGPPLVQLLEQESQRSRRHAITKMMIASAPRLAPGLVAHFPHRRWFVTRNLAMVLGHAGPGYEASLAAVVHVDDIRVAREALRGLGRIGSPMARDVVVGALDARREIARVAEEVFWSFPDARRIAVAMLGDEAFAGRRPMLARRLLVRAADTARADLADVARPLSTFRFHLWRPSHVWLGFTAARLAR